MDIYPFFTRTEWSQVHYANRPVVRHAACPGRFASSLPLPGDLLRREFGAGRRPAWPCALAFGGGQSQSLRLRRMGSVFCFLDFAPGIGYYEHSICRGFPETAERCWSGRTGLPAKQLYWQNRYRGFESPPLRHAFYFQIAYRLFKRVFAFCCPKILHPVIYLPIKSDM